MAKRIIIVVISMLLIVSLGVVSLLYLRGYSLRWGKPIPVKYISITGRIPVFEDTPEGPNCNTIISYFEKDTSMEVIVGYKFKQALPMFKVKLPDGRTGWVFYNAFVVAYGPDEVSSLAEIQKSASAPHFQEMELNEDTLREDLNKTVNGK